MCLALIFNEEKHFKFDRSKYFVCFTELKSKEIQFKTKSNVHTTLVIQL